MSEQIQNPRAGRLQRMPDFTGNRISQFKQVLLRHGLPVLIFASVCLLFPDMRAALSGAMLQTMQTPLPYLIALGALLVFFVASAEFYRRVNLQQVSWVLYLLGISICEEWVFRLALPGFVANYVPTAVAIVSCNLIFAIMHYFTLRWRLIWCVGVFFGAMGLSRLMSLGDLTLLIFVHWLATYINTPKPPAV